MMLTIAANELHVWLLDFTQAQDKTLLEAYTKLLSPAEMDRLAKFKFVGMRQKYLATRAMIRCCLSHYAEVDPSQWQFASTQSGKPYLTNGNLPLTFNLSHSGERAALIVAAGAQVGIDIERGNAKRDIYGIAEHYFHTDEFSDLQQLAPAQQADHFFRLWTLKEAYLKARGSGISTGLEKVIFTLTGGQISCRLARELADNSNHWQFLNAEFNNDYYLSLAAHIPHDQALAIRFFNTVPLTASNHERNCMVPTIVAASNRSTLDTLAAPA